MEESTVLADPSRKELSIVPSLASKDQKIKKVQYYLTRKVRQTHLNKRILELLELYSDKGSDKTIDPYR